MVWSVSEVLAIAAAGRVRSWDSTHGQRWPGCHEEPQSLREGRAVLVRCPGFVWLRF